VQLVSDRRYRFAAAPDDVWSALADTARYRSWWPWLTAFDAPPLAAGQAWRCAVRPPFGYTLRFTIHLDEVVAARLVTADLSGELVGTARLELSPSGDDGTALRLVSRLRAGHRGFSVLATLARPVVRRGHDWVLDTGARQFAQRGLPASTRR
jgi:uncharacterized protein YndB with AHSA1/START domain